MEDVTRTAQQPTNTEVMQGGYLTYTFRLVAQPDSPDQVQGLIDRFYQWLGCHVVETYVNDTVWEGMICQMDLSLGRVRRRRSLIDQEVPVYNAIRASYTASSIAESDELMENGGFETASIDTSHTFETFGNVAGDGAIASVGTVHGGAAAARLTAGASANTKIGKTIRAQAETQYRLSFWTRGDGTHAGRYEIYDVTAGASIVAVTSTGITGTTYTQVNVDFTTPVDCTGVQVWLMCPSTNTGQAYFDDASLKQYQPTQLNTAYTVNDESVDRYGRIEHTITQTASGSQANAQQAVDMMLQERAWPVAFPVAISQQDQGAVLDITCCGYIITADWQESEVELGGEVDLSQAIDDLVTTDCPFLTVGQIDENTLQVDDQDLSGTTPRQRIDKLVSLGDASLNLYRAYVGPGRLFYYVKIDDLTPTYHLMPDGIRANLSGPLLEPWEVHPGVMRDETYPVQTAEEGSQFNDARDMLVTERRAAPGMVIPDLRTANLSDADVYVAQLAASGGENGNMD